MSVTDELQVTIHNLTRYPLIVSCPSSTPLCPPRSFTASAVASSSSSCSRSTLLRAPSALGGGLDEKAAANGELERTPGGSITLAPAGGGATTVALRPATQSFKGLRFRAYDLCLRSPDGEVAFDFHLHLLVRVAGVLKGWPGKGRRERWAKVAVVGRDGSRVLAWQSVYHNTPDALHLVVRERRDLAEWMADVPDDRPLSAMTIPGSHEGKGSGARLIACHGISNQRLSFSSILDAVLAFLASYPSETVVMSIKQEDDRPEFASLVRIAHILPYADRWFLESRVPTLGEVRGRIVLFSRFGRPADTGIGVHPTVWPNNARTPFEWWCGGTKVVTQDWYNIGSFLNIKDKWFKIRDLIISTGGERHTLAINYCSASTFPAALPPLVAKGAGYRCLRVEGINERLQRFLMESCVPMGLEGRRVVSGAFLLDFFEHPDAELVDLLVECNFAGLGNV